MTDDTRSHLWSNLDKFLLVALVMFFAGAAFWGYHVKSDQLSAFATDTSKLFAGALLTLITGKVLSRAGDAQNGSKPPDSPQPAPVPPNASEVKPGPAAAIVEGN